MASVQQPLYGSAVRRFVIPRVCNFIGFAKKPLLKTNSLGASKIAKTNKVTGSERSRGTCGSADLSWECFSKERSVGSV
jgi:hypothetical protein